jgi:hypothetical protein
MTGVEIQGRPDARLHVYAAGSISAIYEGDQARH